MRFRAPYLIGTLALTVLALIVYGWMTIFGWHRPYINWAPWDLAEYLVKNGRPANECWDLIWFEIMSPTAAEQRASCIYSYAKTAKDPSACELLMPSSYGWSCLGAVTGKLWEGVGCGSTKEKINCGAYNVFSPNLGIDDCNAYDQRILRDWCHEERSASLPNVYECDKISTDPPGLREICERRYAFKMKDPSLCAKMPNEKKRKLCEMEINAWQQYSQNWSFAR